MALFVEQFPSLLLDLEKGLALNTQEATLKCPGNYLEVLEIAWQHRSQQEVPLVVHPYLPGKVSHGPQAVDF
eukprot:3558994-Amphidinium_carterae.1